LSAGFDQIPEFLVQEPVQYIKNSFFFIFDVAINKVIFPDLIKISKLRPIYKKGDMTVIITAYVLFISVLKNFRKTNV